jgi:hypothetical protein
MMPTADQVARAIIQAAKECDFLDILKRQPLILTTQPQRGRTKTEDKLRHVKAYVVLALRAAFPDCGSITIGRMVGSANPSFLVGVLLAYKAKGQLPWHDPEAEARVIAAMGPIDWNPEQTIVDETGNDPVVTSVPAFLPVGPPAIERFVPLESARPRSKSKLEEELRQAILNTGGRLA